MKRLHMPLPRPPSAGHFDYCRKPLFHPISASPLLTHTVICIFSPGSLPHLSIHPVTPVIHLFFFFFYSPLFLLWQCRTSSKFTASHGHLCLLWAFLLIRKKCSHPFLSNTPHNNIRWQRIAKELQNAWTYPLIFQIVLHMKSFFFFVRGFACYLVLSCSHRTHRLSRACSLACRQAERGSGEERVRRRERLANEVWVKIIGC